MGGMKESQASLCVLFPALQIPVESNPHNFTDDGFFPTLFMGKITNYDETFPDTAYRKILNFSDK